MKRSQWFVLGWGFLIFGILFYRIAHKCYPLTMSETTLISCSIQRYANIIPAMILISLGVLFNICGVLEKKKNE